MQVSWIDPEEIKTLARQLLDPVPSRATSTPEVQRLPDPASLASGPLIDSNFEPSAPQLPSAELELIRAKLRHIRDRAKSAGLLVEPPPAPPVAAPAPTFVPPAAPSSTKVHIFPQATPANSTPPPVAAEVPPESASSTSEEAAPISATFQPEPGSIAERLHSFATWGVEQTNSEEFLILDHHGDILWGVPSREDLVVQSLLLINRGNSENRPSADVLRTTTSSDKQLTVLRAPTRYGEVTIVTLAAYSPDEPTLTRLQDSIALAINEAQVG